MECPVCGHENPDDASRCVCGYDFRAGAISVRRRYPILRLLSVLLRLAGWIVFIAGVALFVIFILNRLGYAITWQPRVRNWQPALNWLPLHRSLVTLGYGLMLVGTGELLSLGVALEHNTRLASRRLDIMWRSMMRR